MWKCEVKQKGDACWIELRKQFSGGKGQGCANLLVIVAGDRGYDYGKYTIKPDRWDRTTVGTNIHMSLNGPLMLTFAEWQEIQEQVQKAKDILRQ